MEQKSTKNTPVDVTKKDRLAGIKKFLLKRPPKKRLILVASISGFVLFAGLAAAFTLIENPETLNPEPIVVSTYVAPPEPIYSPLTGMETTEELAKRPVTAVMIENSIDARPQSGLQEAGVVFEAIAEGGITRFVALFQEAKPANVGPIRSARPYYVEWLKGFDARYVHSGGSGEALALIQTLGVKDLDHGRYGDQIASRVSGRYAPHNVYTSMDRIDSLGNELGYTSSEYTPFARKDPDEVKEDVPLTAASIAFDISGANYNTSYTYDSKTNSYARVMAGRPHTDQDSGKQITPKVVIALFTEYGIHPDRVHSTYRTIGTGEILVFQDGKVTKGTWKKDSQTATLQLLGLDGKPLPLNAGLKWITAIQTGRVTYNP